MPLFSTNNDADFDELLFDVKISDDYLDLLLENDWLETQEFLDYLDEELDTEDGDIDEEEVEEDDDLSPERRQNTAEANGPEVSTSQ